MVRSFFAAQSQPLATSEAVQLSLKVVRCKNCRKESAGSTREEIMARVAILYCKRIKDHSCVACAKCYKGIHEKAAEFAQHEDIDLVAMTDCGDCPGLVIPRVKLLREVSKGLDREFDVVHLGTCIKTAMETAQCPIDFDELKVRLEKDFGLQVVLGTHAY